MLLWYCVIVQVVFYVAMSDTTQIIGDLVTGRAAESFISHYQTVAYDDSEGIGKVNSVAMVMVILLTVC